MFRTIRSRLFICYTGIITAVVVCFATSFYIHTAAILEQRASESLQQLAININQYLDAEFKNMNATANRVISSEPIKEIFYDRQVTEVQLISNRWNLFQLLFTVTGSSTSNQINLIGKDGTLAQFGKRFEFLPSTQGIGQELDWYNEALDNEGRYTITAPRQSEWPPNDRVVVSVCRAFNQTFGAPYDAIVEVQEDFDNLVRLIETAITLPDNQSNSGVQALVFDQHGQVVYPLNAQSDYYGHLSQRAEAYGTLPLHQSGSTDILAYSRSDYSGWTVAVCQLESALLAPVTTFRNAIIAFGLLILLLTVGVTYIIARQLTEPIRTIRQSISALELHDLSTAGAGSLSSSAYELTALGDAYHTMVQRLEQSLDETVTARSHEIRARMLALQAQMNPHFLYNTITIISIRAEQQGADDVVEMCRCLTAMLRYVTQESAAPVPLQAELDHLQQYLYLMECRFPGQFDVQLDLPQPLLSLSIPKLVLQPLVENSFKHGFTIRAPWHIQLTGQIEADRWQIQVADNGVGFDPQLLAQLQQRIASENPSPDEHSDGQLGLLNIWRRLWLEYHHDAVFTLENLPEGGCCITIGGTL